jgi:hypothetical protein
MTKKRFELVGSGQAHPAEPAQNPLKRLQDVARFRRVTWIRRDDPRWAVLDWIDRKEPVRQKRSLIEAELRNVHLRLLFL